MLQTLIDRDDATEQVAASSNNVRNIINDCYSRAERRFYRDEVSRIPPFEKHLTYADIPAGTTALAIPSDYFEIRWAEARNGERQVILERVAASQIQDKLTNRSFALPQRIAYGNNQWLIDQTAEPIDITVNYYGSLPDVSTITSDDQPHWLVNRGDDLMLYWAAVEAGLYFNSIDKEQLAAWEGKAKDIRDSIIAQEVRQRESGSILRWGSESRFPDRFTASAGRF